MTVTVDRDMERAFAQLYEMQKQLLSGALAPLQIRRPIQDLIEHNFPEDTHFARYSGMLMSPSDWLARLREYNAKYWGGKYTDEDFARAEAQLASVPDDHVQSVDNIYGFHVCGDSDPETFEMWYKVYEGELPGVWRWEELKFDAEHFRLHKLARRYEPGIHLVNINLVAHWEPEDGRTLPEVREQAASQSEILAQFEVISIYGVLTELFMEQDGENLPYTDLPGTEFRTEVPENESDEEKSGPWRSALCCRWHRGDRQARFLAFAVGSRDQGWSAPVLREL